MPDNATTWKLIHSERKALADTLEGLSPVQWAAPSLCAGWSIQLAAGHVLAGAEQTALGFSTGMITVGSVSTPWWTAMPRRLGALAPEEIIERLRARTTTTNHPPAPVAAMLGEVVVHGEDIRRPFGVHAKIATDAIDRMPRDVQDCELPGRHEEAHRRAAACRRRTSTGRMVRDPK